MNMDSLFWSPHFDRFWFVTQKDCEDMDWAKNRCPPGRTQTEVTKANSYVRTRSGHVDAEIKILVCLHWLLHPDCLKLFVMMRRKLAQDIHTYVCVQRRNLSVLDSWSLLPKLRTMFKYGRSKWNVPPKVYTILPVSNEYHSI
jgi:hypothetical protein